MYMSYPNNPDSERKIFMIKKNTAWFPAVFSFFTVLILILVFHCFTPFIFSNSDDFYLKAVVSGELTGTPQAHMLHMNYLTGLFLSSLYRLAPSVPWYGLFLVSCLGLGMAVVLCGLLKCCHTFARRIITCFFFILFSFCVLLQYFSQLQYTTVAGIVCASAVFHFFITDFPGDRHFLRPYLPAFLLLGLSWCIRYKAAMMLMPVLFFLILAKWFSASENRREKHKILLSFAAVCFLMCLLLFLTDLIGYHTPLWRTFRQYNNSRESVYDYRGYPDYDSAETLYSSLGITRSSYQAASSNYEVLLDPAINAASMTSIAEASAASAKQPAVSHLADMCSLFLERQFSKTDRPASFLVFALYLSAVILFLYQKKKKGFLFLTALILGRMSVWFYLLWIDRYPFRVTQTIYLTELFLLMGMICRFYPQEKHEKIQLSTKQLPVFLLSLFVAAVSLHFGISGMRSVCTDSKARLVYSNACQDIQAYMDSRPENFYLCDTMSMTYFTEEALAPQKQHQSNRVLLGSWMAKSPWYDEIFRKYRISDVQTVLFTRPRTYVVVMDAPGVDSDASYLARYYQEYFHSAVHSSVTATVSCREHVTFRILQFSR